MSKNINRRQSMQPRDKWVHFVMSQDELDRMQQKMDELGIRNKSSYLRKMALDGYCVNLELDDVKEKSEQRLVEIGTLKKHIINYSKTRPIYEEYRKAGYSKKFLEAHREEITIHKAAKASFDALGVKKLPKVKELGAEYAEVLAAKKQAFTEYRQMKNEVQELLIAQRNIASLYDAECTEEKKDRRNEERSG